MGLGLAAVAVDAAEDVEVGREEEDNPDSMDSEHPCCHSRHQVVAVVVIGTEAWQLEYLVQTGPHHQLEDILGPSLEALDC